MKKILNISIILMLSWNCISLLPREERRSEKIFETKLTKKEIYDRGLVYLAKSLGNANLAIQVRDEAGGRIVSQGMMNCKDYRPYRYSLNQVYINFNVDLTAKENKYRLIFDDIYVKLTDHYGRPAYSVDPSTKDDLVDIDKSCLEQLRTEIHKGIEGKGITTQSDF